MLSILGTYLDSLDGSFDGSYDGKIEGLFLRVLLGSTDGKFLDSDEVIKLGSNCGKVILTILGNVDGITLGLDIGTELGVLYGSFDGSDDGKPECLLLVDSLGSTDGIVLGFN